MERILQGIQLLQYLSLPFLRLISVLSIPKMQNLEPTIRGECEIESILIIMFCGLMDIEK